MKEIKSKDWQFKPGEGGRPKGVMNKVTADQKKRAEWVLELLDDTLEESISMLKPKEKVDLWLSLQEFIRPKLQRMNVSALPTPSFTIAEPGLPLRQKSGYHENIEVGGNVCQGR